MFATLSDLIYYLFGIHVPLPIQTFGFFMALAFVLPYYVFTSEFKRKEAEGVISAFTEEEWQGQPASITEIAINGLLGYLFGFKVLGILFDYGTFASGAVTYIFSLNGNWLSGLVCAIIFGCWVYSDKRRHRLTEPVLVKKIIHPYQLTPYLVMVLAAWGFVGAKLSSAIEHWNVLLYNPMGVLFSTNGFNFYGGFIFGALAYMYICHNRGMKLIYLSDIGSPGMVLAYAVGRLGCQLSGDGDWGIANIHQKPNWLNWLPDWAWSFTYPHNVIDAGVPIPGCIEQHCQVLPFGVYPTSLYESAAFFLVFALMWAFRRKIKIPGLLFYLFLIFNGAERVLIEMIRITDRHRVFGIQITQAQIIGLLFIAGGITGIIYIITTRNKAVIN
jgi:phosphatidylglycerol:prolipoprotein diacylglycerol transferase